MQSASPGLGKQEDASDPPAPPTPLKSLVRVEHPNLHDCGWKLGLTPGVVE